MKGLRKREFYKNYTIVEHEGETHWTMGFTDIPVSSVTEAKRQIDRL